MKGFKSKEFAYISIILILIIAISYAIIININYFETWIDSAFERTIYSNNIVSQIYLETSEGFAPIYIETPDNQDEASDLNKLTLHEQPGWTIFLPEIRQWAGSIAYLNELAWRPSFELAGLQFNNPDQYISIEIYPQSPEINGGKPIRLKIKPGNTCQFGEKQVCVYAYKRTQEQNVIFISIHSGVGGEAQRLRHAIEGTGINRASLPLKKVKRNLTLFTGSKVIMKQGNKILDNLVLQGMNRIPASDVQAYFSQPIENILDFAMRLDPELEKSIRPSIPIIIIETCGWKMPGEPKGPGISDTTGSVYMSIIQPSNMK
jgi:hypothetical protein